jgi:hypothetical protein
MGSKKQGDYELVYGKTSKYQDGFFETEVFFNH